MQAWAEAKRANALDLFQELGEMPPAFPEHLFATVETRVAKFSCFSARNALDFSIEDQLALSAQERSQLPNVLRRKLEQIGILALKNAVLRELGVHGICFVSLSATDSSFWK